MMVERSSPTAVIDGRARARSLQLQVAFDVERLAGLGVRCGLATVLVGSDYAAQAYARRLARAASAVGIVHRHHPLPENTTREEVLELVVGLGADPTVSGILVLRPLPPHLDEGEIFTALDPAKDIEAVHPENAGLLALGTPRFVPSTPASVFHLLDAWLDEVGVEGEAFYGASTICVVGRSNNVGKPAATLAAERGAVVVTCDENASRTGRLAQYTRLGDVLVVAAGVPGLIGVEHVAPGAVVLDVGINPVRDPVTGRTRLVGDVDPAVAAVARAATPVPGGVGPVTDVWLVQNTVLAAERAAKRR
ncbi:bifunctional 5,10-methylenetetrahydrofolate dehydrogenase/5,10-methenyltetrahydrofolate cyclohydrolase [Actinomycetospora lutea]|uniref:bifunctional 5,10-methylenetetrahydrofolate dehydrogenase/5,10-methenyltetrahydrofolate cyclohydrolase n=1 Tax=Actinomycetospora lutea TaxID=663604 RepID=UPI002366AFD4|nr:bifunctional 5,10-methylenetetrahydrofolate dehydrogenase/5,10-methenyltetrahydrofolate cyclohydrolase [Actinomycetospora lutea]MDD7941588.1 bifunctional 5,10-methylenetetrahydrofolate dehydrogenase/5,10-methenyltetrahydrofolate cyclohydrolase [Actinomycetospora lutea]